MFVTYKKKGSGKEMDNFNPPHSFDTGEVVSVTICEVGFIILRYIRRDEGTEVR